MEPKLIDRTVIDESVLTAYVRVEHVLALRVEGPFTLQTPIGRVLCEDGYVVKYDDGRLFAMRTPDFERAYTPTVRRESREEVLATVGGGTPQKAITITPDS